MGQMARIKGATAIFLCTAGITGCAPKYAVIATDSLCKDWRVQSISKEDKLTQGTAEGIEGSNKSRPAWGCDPKENRAKG